ncbi:phosphatidylinositol-4-phosphate 5-kinase [Trypanosoma theileri]|uniref:Phosphatidylinositol-4-phosphate 5-kinase n=1 Tax=Trypanosoma theileri TaxID=67003 RepID=A0A1X0NVI1_9TRYP|nr:phosphatidylinositol-4-phosphate 5-kinase [Trypanosoma theileri]ORC88493.1 phosphatidylinositol-4-phosphate 5-kinase [Trypanosoma theileri]
MYLARAAAQGYGTGLHDSAIKSQVSINATGSTKLGVNITPLVHSIIEEPIRIFISTGECKSIGDRQLPNSRAAVLCGGGVRPYTEDEVRATAGSEFASGKAIHTFKGHYRQCKDGSSSCTMNIKEGEGGMYFADGGFFLGSWVNNQRSGMGALYSSVGYAYEGNFKDDVPHGFGLEYFPAGQAYVGEFAEGRPHGSGVIYYPRNGTIYVGEFSRGEKHGSGVVFYANGEVFEGRWVGGRRCGEGISTTVKKGTTSHSDSVTIFQESFRAQWNRDKCKWETIRIDYTHKPPSLEQYIKDGMISLFEDIESPLGYSVGTLSVAHELVHEIPLALLHRLERCFDKLDEMCTGEVPLTTLQAAFEPFPSKNNVLNSILKATQSSSSDSFIPGHLNFMMFLQGLFPHLSESDIYRHLMKEIPLETLFRLRGELAGVVSTRNDGFLQLVETNCQNLAFYKGQKGLHNTKQCTGGITKKGTDENKMTLESIQLNAEELFKLGGVIGGVRVPYGLLLRQKVLHGSERLNFLELLEGLYPSISPSFLYRCEVTSFLPHVFNDYLNSFSQLDEEGTCFLSIQGMISARSRFLAVRAIGHERIPSPTNALERLIRPGRQRCYAYWVIGDIMLSIDFARYIDRFKTGLLSLADILRHAYPNIPCLLTKNRLLPSTTVTHSQFHSTGLGLGGGVGNPSTDRLNISSCQCCICTFCATNSLPLSASKA